MTRAACGTLIFTWNAFRIECDPQSVLEGLKLFDMGPDDLHDGVSYQYPGTRGPMPMLRKASGPDGATYVVTLTLDPEMVRRDRIQADISIAMLMRKPLATDNARRAHADEDISGTIAITFETDPTGAVRRRTNITKLEIKGKNGQLETKTATQILERKTVSPNSSGPSI